MEETQTKSDQAIKIINELAQLNMNYGEVMGLITEIIASNAAATIMGNLGEDIEAKDELNRHLIKVHNEIIKILEQNTNYGEDICILAHLLHKALDNVSNYVENVTKII